MATLILTGGGTAGHCIPHLALLPYLKNDFNKIYYIGSENGIEKSLIKQANIPYYSVTCVKLKRKICFDNLKIPFKLISGIKQADNLIKMLKPDVIFSKGGFVSVPVVLAGAKNKIPIVSHESDYTVGLANKFTAKYCKKVLTSFPQTACTLKNGEFVGAPIRNELFKTNKVDALKTFGFSGKKPILLVLGGSQGSKAINDATRTALSNLLIKYDIIHICGKNNVDDNLAFNGYFQTEYLSDINNAFAVADVCVSRAGSNTLFELMALKIPCVLIPLPKGVSRGDQVLNAQYFYNLGLANVLYQENLNKQTLESSINNVYENRFNYQNKLKTLALNNANRQISRIIADCIIYQ